MGSSRGIAPLLATFVVLALVLGGGLGYVYLTSTNSINGLNSSISSQQGVISSQLGVITSQQGAMSVQSSSISTLQGSVSSQSKSILSLQANVTAYTQLVGDLRKLISSDSAQIATLQASGKAANSTIATLNSQIATAQATIANLTATLNLQGSRTLVSGLSVTIYPIGTSSTPFGKFNPDRAGYVLIQVTGASETYLVEGEYTPSKSNPSSAQQLAATGSMTPTYVIVPVTIGSVDGFALVTGSSNPPGTATVTATYFY